MHDKKIKILGCILLITFYSCNILAQTQVAIADVATCIYEPIFLIIQLVRSVSLICGGSLILGGLFRYVDYRRNPVAVPFSRVFFMLLFGISLIAVGLIPMNLVNQ